MTEDETIEALQERVVKAEPWNHPYWVNVPSAYPVASSEAVNRAEEALSFGLPPLLRRIFTEVGNGGSGIPPGIMGILCSDDLRREPPTDERRGEQDDCVALHFSCGNDEPVYWPSKMLMFCDWGCTMWSCVQCRGDHPVYFYDGNEIASMEEQEEASPLDAPSVVDLTLACWMKEADTIGEWFERVVTGEPVGPELKKARGI